MHIPFTPALCPPPEPFAPPSSARFRPRFRSRLWAGEGVAVGRESHALAKSPHRPPHRPDAFSAAVARRIIEAVREGMSASGAARAAGIGEVTLRRWRREAEADPTGKYGAFAVAYLEAEAEAERVALAAWQRGFLAGRKKVVTTYDADGNVKNIKEIEEPPDPYLAKAYIERRWPADWALRRDVHVSTDDRTAATVVYDVEAPADGEAEADALEARGAEQVLMLPRKQRLERDEPDEK